MIRGVLRSHSANEQTGKVSMSVFVVLLANHLRFVVGIAQSQEQKIDFTLIIVA